MACRRKGKANGEAKQPAVTKTATKTRPAGRTRTSHPTGRRTATRPNGKALSTYITERFDEFSRSQKDVARYIVDHLDEAAFQTAEELARRASTSSSTVVRFSQALGFEGFPELQGSARDEYRRRVAQGQADQPGTSSAAPLFSLDQSDVETAVAADHVNVEDTARRMSRSDIDAAIDAIASSTHIPAAPTITRCHLFFNAHELLAST